MKRMNELEQRQFRIFFIVAYIGVLLWAIPLYLAKKQGIALDLFPLTNMNLPAAGVILAILITRKEDRNIPKIPFYGFLIYTLIFIILSLLFLHDPEGSYDQIIPFALIPFIIPFYVEYVVKSRRKNMRAYGMGINNPDILLLFALYFIATFFIRAMGPSFVAGNMREFAFMASMDTAILAGGILLELFIGFLPFFGEEYGWRYFMQPLFQKRFGMVPGVFLTGLFWGLWHLPLNFLYYSADGMGWSSLISQIIFCVLLGIFLAFVYNRTKSVWAPVVIHFLNNNLILLLINPKEPQSPILQNQTYTWDGILYLAGVSLVFYGLFLLSKYVRDSKFRMPTVNEMADVALIKKEVYGEAEERRIQIIEREEDPFEGEEKS